MAKLVSAHFEVTDAVITDYSVFSSKSLMPLDGIIRVWYSKFTGTPAELQQFGMPIPEGKLLEHVMAHDGVISMIAESGAGTINMHEVK